MFEDVDIQILYANKHTNKDLIGNLKDRIMSFEKSGSYEVNCKTAMKSILSKVELLSKHVTTTTKFI